jgi:hypothetical protein
VLPPVEVVVDAVADVPVAAADAVADAVDLGAS